MPDQYTMTWGGWLKYCNTHAADALFRYGKTRPSQCRRNIERARSNHLLSDQEYDVLTAEFRVYQQDYQRYRKGTCFVPAECNAEIWSRCGDGAYTKRRVIHLDENDRSYGGAATAIASTAIL